jgi:hypothetical protein
MEIPGSILAPNVAKRTEYIPYRQAHRLSLRWIRSRPHIAAMWLPMVTIIKLGTYQPVDVLSMGDGVLDALVVTG